MHYLPIVIVILVWPISFFAIRRLNSRWLAVVQLALGAFFLVSFVASGKQVSLFFAFIALLLARRASHVSRPAH